MEMGRDMTQAQFSAALKRHGFRAVYFSGLWFLDTTGRTPDVHFGAVLKPKTFDVNRRETLAHIIAKRDEAVEKSAK
jgi:hypothetical protein